MIIVTLNGHSLNISYCIDRSWGGSRNDRTFANNCSESSERSKNSSLTNEMKPRWQISANSPKLISWRYEGSLSFMAKHNQSRCKYKFEECYRTQDLNSSNRTNSFKALRRRFQTEVENYLKSKNWRLGTYLAICTYTFFKSFGDLWQHNRACIRMAETEAIKDLIFSTNEIKKLIPLLRFDQLYQTPERSMERGRSWV
jgi:hypothetical protein